MMEDDFSDRELSADELEEIAAGWPHWLTNFMKHHPLAAGIIGGVGFAAAGTGFALLVTL